LHVRFKHFEISYYSATIRLNKKRPRPDEPDSRHFERQLFLF
jgi:hypothetical protein